MNNNKSSSQICVLLSLQQHTTMDLQALYLSGTYCQKTSTRPPSCAKPRQPTKYFLSNCLYLTGFQTIFSGLRTLAVNHQQRAVHIAFVAN